MLAPHHLIFTAVEGAIVDARNGSFDAAADAMYEIERRKIPWILISSGTRAEVEAVRKKLGHGHPFVTENGGGMFLPDGYFNVRIAGSERRGRYLCVPLAKPYAEVCEALDDLAEECGVGVAGFHHMSAREIAENTGKRARDAQWAQEREFDEPFYFTNGDDAAIERFQATAKERGYRVTPGETFSRFSFGANAATAVRRLSKLIQDASPVRLQTVGIGSSALDIDWLKCVNHPVMLPEAGNFKAPGGGRRAQNIPQGDAPGPAGWSSTILNVLA